MSALPSVSVLTPSYEQAPFLPDALRSVASQDHPDVEHVVMDGGSTDGSREILAAAGDAVTWRSEPDAGQSDALNKAFALSSGEIVGWINSDDALWRTDTLSRVAAAFASRPDVDVVYGHAAQITADGRIIRMLWSPPYSTRLLETVNFIVQPAAFIRRSALGDRLVDPSLHFCMDWDLWLRIARTGRFLRLDEVLAVDRHHGARKTEQLRAVFEADAELLCTSGLRRPLPGWERWQAAYHVTRRLMGARLVGRAAAPLAFAHPDDAAAGLLRRQVLQRRRDWPQEYR